MWNNQNPHEHDSSIKQTQEQLHNPITTIQGKTLESCGEEFYAENLPAGA
jgi:hypothetical protein